MALSRTGIYINTMVFTIIAAVVCMLLFLALYFGTGSMGEFSYMIITIELGLLAVIIQAVVRIYLYEARLKKEHSNAMDSALRVQSCPDYWTLHENGAVRECKASYVSPDGMTKFIMHDKSDTVVISDLDKKSVNVVCAEVGARNAPWTDVRTACSSFNAFM